MGADRLLAGLSPRPVGENRRGGGRPRPGVRGRGVVVAAPPGDGIRPRPLVAAPRLPLAARRHGRTSTPLAGPSHGVVRGRSGWRVAVRRTPWPQPDLRDRRG